MATVGPIWLFQTWRPNDVSVMLGKGDGSFQPATTYMTANGPAALGVADMDGDGKPDIVTCANVASEVQVFPGNGDGTFQAPFALASAGYCNSLALGDINRDGHMDIAVANANEVVVFINSAKP
jgi:hypothetical protein